MSLTPQQEAILQRLQKYADVIRREWDATVAAMPGATDEQLIEAVQDKAWREVYGSIN